MLDLLDINDFKTLLHQPATLLLSSQLFIDDSSLRDTIKINEPFIGKEEIEAVVNVLKSGVLTDKGSMGPKVLEFERAFAKYLGARHAVAVCSGTAALHSALLACGVVPGDEVIVPAFTFASTAGAVLLAGAKPIFADIDKDTYNIRPENIERVVTRKTKAIIPVHLYGLPSDMGPIIDLARARGIMVIEDAAQAHGATYNGKMVGTLGELACFSFYAGKNITTGEGGMVTTNDDDLAETIRALRTHGEAKPYWVTRIGHNYRMTELEAAIGTVQLGRLPGFLERRRKNAELLTERFSTFGKIILPIEPEDRRHAWYLYTVRLRGANAGKRNKVVERLRAKNVEASVYYETPIHLMPLYREFLGYKRGMYQEAEKASRQVFSLPVHPNLSPEDIEHIVENTKRVVT